MDRVGVLGLGRMGAALAQALETGDHPLTVWNRSPDKCEPFAAGRAEIAASVGELVDRSDVIVVCVHDYAVTAELLRPPAVTAALAGKVVVQLSTGTPNDAREAAAWAGAHGIGYIDGAIMAFPQDISTPSALVLYSGPAATYEDIAGIVAAFGGTAAFVGDEVATAAAIDNGILSIYYGFLLGVLNGAGICSAFDVPLTTLNDLVTGAMPTLASVMERTLDMAARGDFTTDQSTVGTTIGALGHVAAVSEQAGLDLSFVQCAQRYAARAHAMGHGGHNPAAMFEAFTRPDGGSEH